MQEAHDRAARPAAVRRIRFEDEHQANGQADDQADGQADSQTEVLARPLDFEQTVETVGADGVNGLPRQTQKTDENGNESGYTSNIGQ